MEYICTGKQAGMSTPPPANLRRQAEADFLLNLPPSIPTPLQMTCRRKEIAAYQTIANGNYWSSVTEKNMNPGCLKLSPKSTEAATSIVEVMPSGSIS